MDSICSLWDILRNLRNLSDLFAIWCVGNLIHLSQFQNFKACALKMQAGSPYNGRIFFFWTSSIESGLFSVIRKITMKVYELNFML